MFKLNRDANERFLIGEKITDDEVLDLLKFYQDTEANLSQLGCEFKFAKRELFEQLNKIKHYAHARGLY